MERHFPNSKIGFTKGELDTQAENTLKYDSPFIVEGKIGKKKYRFNIDSGSSLDFHFPRNIIEELDYENTQEVIKANRANSEFLLYGAVVNDRIQLGKVEKKNFHVYYSETARSINVGSAFLKSHKLTIDQRNKCLAIE